MAEISGYLFFFMEITILALLYSLLALSLNLQMGYTGLPNFGLIGFFAIGAYTSAVLAQKGVNPLIGIVIGMIIAIGFGIMLTIPTMRLQEDYFALVTIAIGEVVRIIVSNNKICGGKLGLFDIPTLFGLDPMSHELVSFMIMAAIVLFTLAGIQFLIYYTPYGRILKAIRDNEDAVKSLGKDPLKYKLLAFAIGGMFASLAGSLYLHTQRYIAPLNIIPYYTFIVWAMVLLGGIGNNKGVVLGAFIIIFIQQSVNLVKDKFQGILDPNQVISLTQVVIGMLIIIVLIYLPKGVRKEPKVVSSHIERCIKPKELKIRIQFWYKYKNKKTKKQKTKQNKLSRK